MKEADFYKCKGTARVDCLLCAHGCSLAEGALGLCKVRQAKGGKLYAHNYGRLIAEHADPIEKKPLYHFLPGSKTYSVASPGCNLRCAWCQNWDISQAKPGLSERMPYIAPESLTSFALASGCQSISYTYTEPTVFFEYCRDAAQNAKANNLNNIFVTNGYMSTQAFSDASTWLDAANVDIKAFDEAVYQRYMGGHLQPVLENCEAMVQAGIWLEVTTLLIPGLNDDSAQLEKLAAFIAEKLGRNVPWHISKYFPNYQYDLSAPTSMRSIQNAVFIGRKAGLKFIYVGNVDLDLPTRCPNCGEVLIERQGFQVLYNKIEESACPACKTKIPGVWSRGNCVNFTSLNKT
ncbi:MAG: AmmeMemoRadiSam system radical SAM enzyme [Anaerolineaceae bacterium]|nr:AmmeMemoRadiSam system radical SAM enzyme [Anaerolineaceae bacterium]